MRKRAVIEASLQSKGFVLVSDGDHRRLVFCRDGKWTSVKTKVSHGTQHRDIGDTLINLMAKQCHLTKREFLELVDCALSQEEYGNLLATRGVGRE